MKTRGRWATGQGGQSAQPVPQEPPCGMAAGTAVRRAGHLGEQFSEVANGQTGRGREVGHFPVL